MRVSSDSDSRKAEDDRVFSGRKRLRNLTEGLTVCEMEGQRREIAHVVPECNVHVWLVWLQHCVQHVCV